jgi:hypothetical protein
MQCTARAACPTARRTSTRAPQSGVACEPSKKSSKNSVPVVGDQVPLQASQKRAGTTLTMIEHALTTLLFLILTVITFSAFVGVWPHEGLWRPGALDHLPRLEDGLRGVASQMTSLGALLPISPLRVNPFAVLADAVGVDVVSAALGGACVGLSFALGLLFVGWRVRFTQATRETKTGARKNSPSLPPTPIKPLFRCR